MENSPLLNKVLRYVSIRPRSRKEIVTYIQEKLYSKKNTSEEIEHTLSRIIAILEDLNLVDDENFARSFIEWRLISSNPKGFRIIKNELSIKGVDRDLVESLLEEYGFKDMEVVAAKKVVSKKSKTYKDPRELKNYLFARGFSQFSISTALES